MRLNFQKDIFNGLSNSERIKVECHSFYTAQAWARKMKFYTIDIEAPRDFVPCFNLFDLKDGIPKHWDFFSKEPGVLFCDNGNKPAEVFHYHDMLHRGSFIAVHDWGTEFTPRDIPDSLRAYKSTGSTVILGRNDYLNELEVERL